MQKLNKLFLATLSLSMISFLSSSCGSVTDDGGKPASDSELASFDEERETYQNPIELPYANGAKEAPDPFIYRFDGKYYLYMTTSGGAVRGYVSDDLVNFVPVEGNGLSKGVVYEYSSDPNSPAQKTPFAPEVIYYNGYFYMITSPNGSGPYILQSDSPIGPFEAITGNLSKSIDSSFFIDSDEQIYVFTAGSPNINLYKLKDDFTGFENGSGNSEFHTNLVNCTLGSWTEGPYMLKRQGRYYLTYTGTHYLSTDYRVDYSYSPIGSDISSFNSYTQKGNLLISTTDDFYGLGHSCTVLGPDLDSYYVVYHELEDNRQRGLCVSRLSFDGSDMVSSSLKSENDYVPDMPLFAAYGTDNMVESDGFLLSNSSSDDDFTAEFNVVGTGKMIFGYNDTKNYSYLELSDSSIDIYRVKDGKKNYVDGVDFNKSYDFSALHTLRISYADGLADIYFDSIEKAAGIEADLVGGKIGFLSDNSFDDISYVSLSDHGRGSSDQTEYKKGRVLVNSYDRKLSYFRKGSGLSETDGGTFIKQDYQNIKLVNEGDRATYRISVDEDGQYYLNLRVTADSISSKIGVRVNDGDIKEYDISSGVPKVKNGEVELILSGIGLDAGQNNLSFYEVGDAYTLSDFSLEYDDDGEDIDDEFADSTSLGNYDVRGDITSTDAGLKTSDDEFDTLTTISSYTNYRIEVSLEVKELLAGGYFGLMLNGNDYSRDGKYEGDSEYRAGNNDVNYRGLRLSFDSDGIYRLESIDYNYEGVSYLKGKYSLLDGMNTIEVEKKGNLFTFSLNGEELSSVYTNVVEMRGILGVLSYKLETTISSLKITNI